MNDIADAHKFYAKGSLFVPGTVLEGVCEHMYRCS